ncbi:hypothetical protein [Flavilitoribacter nigricans]|nr:hypothetical protein [Flavilitoribacter nigricans]
MDEPFFSLGKDGVGVRFDVAVDQISAFWIGLALFLALVGALAIYARVLK